MYKEVRPDTDMMAADRPPACHGTSGVRLANTGAEMEIKVIALQAFVVMRITSVCGIAGSKTCLAGSSAPVYSCHVVDECTAFIDSVSDITP